MTQLVVKTIKNKQLQCFSTATSYNDEQCWVWPGIQSYGCAARQSIA